MTLPAPNLDSRSFDDLVREARDRIPRFTPEWTNFNDSDPGMTLVKLHAWMTETILYELNRVPDLNYVKFLDLVGIAPRPATAARTQLKAQLDLLDRPDDPLVVDVPLGARVAVDDPALARELVFETDRALRALNAAIGAVIVPSGALSPPRKLVTRYEDGLTWLHDFDPFGPDAAAGQVLYLGLLLRPDVKPPLSRYSEDRMPAGPLELFADPADPVPRSLSADHLDGPAAAGLSADRERPDAGSRLAWQAFTGDPQAPGLFGDAAAAPGWSDLVLSRDTTRDLTRAGEMVLELPAGLAPLSPLDLSFDFWRSFGADKPPQTEAELERALSDGPPGLLAGLADHWQTMGVEEEDRAGFAACGESVPDTLAKIAARRADGLPALDPARLTLADWTAISPDYAQAFPQADGAYRRLHWLRLRLDAPLPAGEPGVRPLSALHLNTVSATQAVTRLDEALGRSNGRPAQRFTLARTPVLTDPARQAPDLDLTVGGEPWQRVPDFFRSGPGDTHYLIDPGTGTVSFGDGRRGRIPVAGAQVVAARYRFGGGRIGNVPTGTVRKIKGRIQNVKSLTNIRDASGGSDAETPEEVRLRAPSTLRSRDRAVTADDFRDLALETPGVPLHSATALARTRAQRQPDGSYLLQPEADGAVTLIALPDSAGAAPRLSDEQAAAICAWLEPRRLITTELHVIGPSYVPLTRLAARVRIAEGQDIATVTAALYTALEDLLHPIRGGRGGTGWGFGETIFYADLYARMLAVGGVRQVSALDVATALAAGDAAQGAVTLPPGKLPELSREVIDLTVSYG